MNRSIPWGETSAQSLHPSTFQIVRQELRRNALKLVGLVMLILVVTGVNVVAPMLYKLLIDEAIPQADLHEILVLSLGIVAVPMAVMGLSALQDYLRASIGVSVANALRQKLFDHLIRCRLVELERFKSSDVVYRLTRACGQVGTVYISEKLLPLVSSVLLLAGYTAIMFAVCWQLALIAVLALPLSYAFAQKFTNHTYGVDKALMGVLESGESYLKDVFQGIRLVRSDSGEAYEMARWDDWLHTYFGSYMRSYVAHNTYLFLAGFINNFLTGIVYGCGAYLVVRGQISLGGLVAFVFYVPGAYAALKVIFQGKVSFGEVKVAAERIDSLFTTSAEAAGQVRLAAEAQRGVKVVFKDVSFSYGREDFDLRGLSFCIQPGQFVGIVGATGCGKTTILDLLVRFYEPSAGQITLDDVEIGELSLDSLRRTISLVPQDLFLWNASIRENLTYPRGDYPEEELIHAAQLAQIHDFLRGLPQGYATPASERGMSFSGGERQRLAIAHALLKGPRLLLLDEATSALDTLTEQRLREAIETIRGGRTMVTVAHRLSTIMKADQILVLEKGRLVEQGSPAELLERKGQFWQLWKAQQGGVE